MLKKENLCYYGGLASVIVLGVMAIRTEFQRHKKAIECINLKAENLALKLEIDYLNDRCEELQKQYDEVLDDVHEFERV